MVQKDISTDNDRANVLLFPPAVGAILVLLGLGLHLVYPFNIPFDGQLALIVGVLVLAIGIGLQVVRIRALKSAKTTPLFKQPTRQVLQRGPYAKSRNPIYVAVLIQVLGLALIAGTMWLILLLPVLFVYLHFGVIAAEERYLEQKFGDEYRAYKSDVRRWI